VKTTVVVTSNRKLTIRPVSVSFTELGYAYIRIYVFNRDTTRRARGHTHLRRVENSADAACGEGSGRERRGANKRTAKHFITRVRTSRVT